MSGYEQDALLQAKLSLEAQKHCKHARTGARLPGSGWPWPSA